MQTIDLIQKLKLLPKTYFSLQDIEKLYEGNIKSLPVTLTRLVKKGVLQKIMRSYYCFSIQQVDFESFTCEVKKPSYISLEYALYHHGLIDQIPEIITLITITKSQKLQTAEKMLEYSHINPDLYFSYEIIGNTLMATKEKALLDELYLIGLGKRSLTLQKEWFEKIDKKLFQQHLKKYPAWLWQSSMLLNLVSNPYYFCRRIKKQS